MITPLLFSRDVIPSLLFCLSTYFEVTREEYYSRLLGVTGRGEWEKWLNYFLKGVALQAGDVVARIQRLDDLLSPWKWEIPQDRSPLPGRVLDLFTENPYWSVGGVADRLEVAYTPAQRAIDRLEHLGIVFLVGRRATQSYLLRPVYSRCAGRGYRHPRVAGVHVGEKRVGRLSSPLGDAPNT